MSQTQFKKLQHATFLFLLTAVTMMFGFVVHDYIMPIFWAVVFSILFFPVQKKLVEKTNSQNLSSILTIILILLVCFVPFFVVGGLVFQESVSIYQAINTSGDISVDILERFSHTITYLERFGISELEAKDRIIAYTKAGASWLAGEALSFGQKTFIITLQFFLMIYVLFFLLRDGERIREKLIAILPLGDEREIQLLAKFTSTTRAVIKGTLVVGAIQGAAGGFLFSIVGIDGALLWGVLMMILSVIPALGAVLVWLPAGIILLVTGSVLQGIVVLAGGALFVSLIDNILRPILVGQDTKIPDVFVLLSTLGGLAVFGITGFVIGPVLAGLFIVLWNMFEKDFHRDLLRFG